MTPIQTPSVVPVVSSREKFIGFLKGSPVIALVSPFTLWTPSTLMKATDSPGLITRLEGVKAYFVKSTVWSASHGP